MRIYLENSSKNSRFRTGMSFSDKKEQQLKEQPKIETKIFKSKTGSHIVYQTIITETKAVEYMQTILDNAPLDS